MKHMEAFFKKYPIEASEIIALEMIDVKLDYAIETLKEDKKSEEYLKYLATAYAMLDDFFEEKQLSPTDYL